MADTDLAEILTGLREAIADLKAEPGEVSFDQDGWTRTLIMVDTLRPGDLVSNTSTQPGAYPMTWRVLPNGRLRNEFGTVWEAKSAPGPWRLIWRQPEAAPEPEKPARKGRKKPPEPEEG